MTAFTTSERRILWASWDYINIFDLRLFRSAALHTPRDPIAAVVGLDLPANYIQRLLLDLIPTCSVKGIRCFMLDDKGYIITHPNLKLTNNQRSFEQQHLTHMVSGNKPFVIGTN